MRISDWSSDVSLPISRKDIRWSALGLGSADNAHALARTFETAEDLADLLATMLGAERAAEQGHARGGRRRAREVHIEPLFEQRLPHHRALFEVGHDDGDDRRLRLFGAEREAQILESPVEHLQIGRAHV